jgi:hypothetical protein
LGIGAFLLIEAVICDDFFSIGIGAALKLFFFERSI